MVCLKPERDKLRFMGKKKGNVVKLNTTCFSCGRLATNRCLFCNRAICDSCSREWPVEETRVDGRDANGTPSIITCKEENCQSKISQSTRDQVSLVLKKEIQKTSDYSEWS